VLSRQGVRRVVLAGALSITSPVVMVSAQSGASATRAVTAAASTPPRPGRVHTDTLWSQSLGIRKALTVYLPPSYDRSVSRRYPVLVYLHGLTGNERNWVDAGKLDSTLDVLAAAGRGEAIVVMPDGDDGWYTTWNSLAVSPPCASDTTRKEAAASFCVPWTHYDDYIAHDIVQHVDAHYRTLADRRHRGIAGLSMGGYGAMSLALSYPEIFGAAASHSGVLSPRLLSPRPYPVNAPAPAAPTYAIDTAGFKASSTWLWRYLAPVFGHDSISWTARDPGYIAVRALARARDTHVPMPALFIDCGAQDGFVDENRDFDATLRRLGVSHQYAEWPGKHDWTYWRAHAAESLTFLLTRTAR
jgi:S-formylglutathione hydrolase FrmB